MATGVFGTPITIDTVRATGSYPEPISQRDCADYAEKMINGQGRDVDALKYLENLNQKYMSEGSGSMSAKCLIYNATGTTLNFADYQDWYGNIYDTPHPATIMNGQWGAFLHVRGGFCRGSAGAVVYRSLLPLEDSESCDWLFSWSVPYVACIGFSNQIYTEIREKDHFPKHWSYLYHQKLENSVRFSEDKQYGYWSNTMIGEGSMVVARAVFKYPPSSK